MDMLHVYNNTQLLSVPVTCFKVKEEHPLLFFSLLRTKISQENSSVVIFDLAQQSPQELCIQLESSFLGIARLCWLGFIDDLPKALMQKWQQYIGNYQGPNHLLYVTAAGSKVSQNQHIIEVLEDTITKKKCIELFTFFVRKPKQTDLAKIDQIYAKLGTLKLDALCLLFQYIQLIGVNEREFTDYWLEQLIVPQQSLFSVSQYLFARDANSFFVQWKDIKSTYSEQFWISFWSDQLLRAAFYCKYMKEAKWIEAKKIGYRLPFSYLQKDYNKFTFTELYNAHNWLYKFDYNVKQGVHSVGLDLFVYHFFAKEYANHS